MQRMYVTVVEFKNADEKYALISFFRIYVGQQNLSMNDSVVQKFLLLRN